jgi:hypothetical protein
MVHFHSLTMADCSRGGDADTSRNGDVPGECRNICAAGRWAPAAVRGAILHAADEDAADAARQRKEEMGQWCVGLNDYPQESSAKCLLQVAVRVYCDEEEAASCCA